jgi:polysaccharide deacetylase 2 family uncharacterized protein YibQ
LLSLYLLFGADWPGSSAKTGEPSKSASGFTTEAPSEVPFSGSLDDEVLQVDFALAQSLGRLRWSTAQMRITLNESRERNGLSYRYKALTVYAGDEAALFIRTLRDALLAWAEKAALEQSGGDGAWNIVLDGVVTHSLYIAGERAPVSARIPSVSGQDGWAQIQPDTPPRDNLKLAIVLDDLGESTAQAEFLLELDYPVTFAVWPHSTHAGEVAELAASRGRELIIHQPMEPVDYPKNNPGEGALLSRMTDSDFLALLRGNLKLVPKASGLNNHMGSWLTQNVTLMTLVARELKEQDFFVLDSLTHPRSRFAGAAIQEGVPAYRRDVFLDVRPEREQVLAQLRKAENIARLKGQAIAIGHPLPGTLAALKEWQLLRDRRIDIVRLRDLKALK